MKKLRGIFEKHPGSEIWWIRYADVSGRIRREKAGTRSAAQELYRKRKQQTLEGLKLPEKFARSQRVTVREFSNKFLTAVQTRCANKPRTARFYEEQTKRLLEFGPLANAVLTEVDERLIEAFVQKRGTDLARRWTKKGLKVSTTRQVSVSTVNRGLATLRRLLRLAQEWRVIDRVPRIRMIPGERTRDFVLSSEGEQVYLSFAPQPLRDVALLTLDTGLRIGEALALEWQDVHLGKESERGYVQVRSGKSRNARRTVPLTRRAQEMLAGRKLRTSSRVFAGAKAEAPCPTLLDHQHGRLRKKLKLASDFVLHSLRHTYLTRLGLAGVDAFTIMKLAGHSSITVSQRYVHPTPASAELAVAKLDNMNLRSLESNMVASSKLPEPVPSPREILVAN